MKQVPILVVSAILHHTNTSDDLEDNMLDIANMICIGFFFLCRPGEHSLSTNNAPFCLKNVTLHRGAGTLTYETTHKRRV